jgi:hypothetical protein
MECDIEVIPVEISLVLGDSDEGTGLKRGKGHDNCICLPARLKLGVGDIPPAKHDKS